MELNAEQRQALELMKSGQNVFLRGDAGTGKTVVINRFIDSDPDRIVSLAPTGLAASNLKHGGMTIHRFLGALSKDWAQDPERVREYLHSLRGLIIEEISMVRSDLFCRLDHDLRFYTGRDQPFGGIPLVVVGDFYQLPPVVKSKPEKEFLEKNMNGIFAFNAPAWKSAEFRNAELKTPHRQTDQGFLNLLRTVRTGTDGLEELLRRLDSQVRRQPPPLSRSLCCYRKQADTINTAHVDRLLTPGGHYTGKCSGCYPESEWPAPVHLNVKSGMLALLSANDPEGRYANGDVGEVLACWDNSIWIRLLRGPEIAVYRHTWFNYDYRIVIQPDGSLKLDSHIIGYFTQFPVLPAYAMTIHKAQGQTLNQVHLELGGRPCFASGQLYTALSRVRNLEDLTLNRPLQVADVVVDRQVQRFYERLED